MAGHKLDAERMGLDRDPQRPQAPEESTELTTNVKTAVFWLVLIAVVVGAWTFVRTRSRPPHSSPPSTALELKAERSEGRLLVTWNRESEVVLNAQQATLTITDGDHTEDVPVDVGQVRGGSVDYAPITSDVTLRLEVVSRGGKSRSETVRVISARRPSRHAAGFPRNKWRHSAPYGRGGAGPDRGRMIKKCT
jgi:hypothetical protein